MKFFTRLSDVAAIPENGHTSYEMLTEANGCVAGCCTGVSIYPEIEYSGINVHDDQEGFFVLEGSGWAKVGDQEFPIEPAVSFIVPAKTPHCIKKDPTSKPVKAFWFHSAIG